MESVPLPSFTILLFTTSLAVFVVTAFLLFLWRGPAGSSALASALTPFLIPVGVASLSATIISSIGALLLTVGKFFAVPVALGVATAVLVIAWLAASRSSGPVGTE